LLEPDFMKLTIPNQTQNCETRVALIPAVVKRLVAAGVEVVLESGAGLRTHATDEAYEQAGAKVVAGGGEAPAEIWSQADMVVTLSPPTPGQVEAMKSGAVVAGMLSPLVNKELIQKLAAKGVTAISMEFVPRISRAQSMDVLSSQANIAGYKAVITAAEQCPKMFPMMITAAGTIAPAKVFIIGVGVAGLQAIATAKRLGAVVEAYDVRPATKDQVQSLGARFVELPMAAKDAETKGGYAREQTEEERKQQTELMAKHVIGADVVITTAAVFGKAPPMLIPADVVKRMNHGSVIVDLAADAKSGRGNCELTKPGEIVTTENGATIIGRLNLPATVPVHASQVYANNIHALLKELIKDNAIAINLEDEVQKGAVITHGGKVVNEMVAQALNGSAS
jgi:NAD(P) transhydrogenase subunit alpha